MIGGKILRCLSLLYFCYSTDSISNNIQYRTLYKNIDTISFSRKVSRIILKELQDNECLMCNAEFSNNVPMEIHHVDHNRQNNTLKNFAALCSNCHAGHHRYLIEFPRKKHEKLFDNIKFKKILEKNHKKKRISQVDQTPT